MLTPKRGRTHHQINIGRTRNKTDNDKKLSTTTYNICTNILTMYTKSKYANYDNLEQQQLQDYLRIIIYSTDYQYDRKCYYNYKMDTQLLMYNANK